MGTDNLFHRRKAKQASDLQRRRARRATYDKVLIVCEGEKTEPNYFNELKDHYRLNSANIRVAGECDSDPMSVVTYARQKYREARDAGDAYDRVYCVFDKDRHTNYLQTLDVIKRTQPKKVFIAITSVPCFEYWLLLHFIYTDQPFHATGNSSICTMVIKELRQYWPEYEKGSFDVFGRLLGQLEFAKANAKHGLREAESNHTDNPSTQAHELVEYLQDLILPKN
jgi:hypothetical protein